MTNRKRNLALALLFAASGAMGLHALWRQAWTAAYTDDMVSTLYTRGLLNHDETDAWLQEDGYPKGTSFAALLNDQSATADTSMLLSTGFSAVGLVVALVATFRADPLSKQKGPAPTRKAPSDT
ncbi:MAG: hypothetical protein GC200_00870 [Tepidisphaera sp.]|nr:hypothetical protein [Tepidisphaera sp.]